MHVEEDGCHAASIILLALPVISGGAGWDVPAELRWSSVIIALFAFDALVTGGFVFGPSSCHS